MLSFSLSNSPTQKMYVQVVTMYIEVTRDRHTLIFHCSHANDFPGQKCISIKERKIIKLKKFFVKAIRYNSAEYAYRHIRLSKAFEVSLSSQFLRGSVAIPMPKLFIKQRCFPRLFANKDRESSLSYYLKHSWAKIIWKGRNNNI